jgi:CBS domain-containing protein/GGDEF domain-containing protein
MLGSSMDRAISKMTTGFGSPSSSVHLETDVRSGYHARDQIDEPNSATSFILRLLVFCFLSAVAIAAASTGWVMLRRRSKKPEDKKPARKKPVEEKVLLNRLNKKRELLWKQLMVDHDLLLKNRIEVRHVMTRDPIVVEKSAPGKRLAEVFSRHHVAHLIVCDKDKRLLGVVKASDHRTNPAAPAQAAMTPPPPSISPKTTLGAAISHLMDQDVPFLPVVDQESLCGIMTPTDLVLTLHCSLQLWFRVAQTMQASEQQAEKLEATNCSMGETADELKHRVQRLPTEVKSAIKTGNAGGLITEINELTAAVSHLMEQLEDARAQIREQSAQIADLKDPAPDEVTGAASREELDRILGRLMPGGGAAQQSLSLVLFAAGGYQKLLREKGREAADDQLRLAVQCVAEHIASFDHVARYRDDVLAIVLPGTGSDAARKLCSRLSAAASSLMGNDPSSRPRMSLVSARTGDSPTELLKRAEAGFVRDSDDRALATAAASA